MKLLHIFLATSLCTAQITQTSSMNSIGSALGKIKWGSIGLATGIYVGKEKTDLVDEVLKAVKGKMEKWKNDILSDTPKSTTDTSNTPTEEKYYKDRTPENNPKN